MFKKLTFAIVSVLMLGTASAAMAQEFDPIPMNRYPQYNGVVAAAPQATLHSAPVALHKDSQVTSANQENWYAVDSADRASSPYSGF
jgi:hypothetical protein